MKIWRDPPPAVINDNAPIFDLISKTLAYQLTVLVTIDDKGPVPGPVYHSFGHQFGH